MQKPPQILSENNFSVPPLPQPARSWRKQLGEVGQFNLNLDCWESNNANKRAPQTYTSEIYKCCFLSVFHVVRPLIISVIFHLKCIRTYLLLFLVLQKETWSYHFLMLTIHLQSKPCIAFISASSQHSLRLSCCIAITTHFVCTLFLNIYIYTLALLSLCVQTPGNPISHNTRVCSVCSIICINYRSHGYWTMVHAAPTHYHHP